MLVRRPIAACFVVASVLFGVGTASAAETGTKTMPDSSIYPPRTSHVYFGTVYHHDCSLPSQPCGNRHRVNN